MQALTCPRPVQALGASLGAVVGKSLLWSKIGRAQPVQRTVQRTIQVVPAAVPRPRLPGLAMHRAAAVMANSVQVCWVAVSPAFSLHSPASGPGTGCTALELLTKC